MPWVLGPDDAGILAVHAALLSTNEILYFGGDQHDEAAHKASNIDHTRIDHTRIFHVMSGTITRVSSPTTDVFCSGHAFLGDGRLLVGGGTEQWGTNPESPAAGAHGHELNFGGHRACWIFDPATHRWTQVATMGGGRWYPTLLTLPSGDVLAVFGHPSRTGSSQHRNNTPELYSPSQNTWRQLDEIAAEDFDEFRPLFYPRLDVLPSGNVFFATPVPLAVPGGQPYSNRLYDPQTEQFVGPIPIIDPPGGALYQRWSATSVLLPLLPADGYRPRVMVCGDEQRFRIDLGPPPAGTVTAWQQAGNRTGPPVEPRLRRREHLCAVLLPTGDVFISGGCSVPDPNPPEGNALVPEDAVLEGETYRPGIDWASLTYSGEQSWVSTEPATVPRNYHSVALLMPNGRVWTAGSSRNAEAGDPNKFAEKRIEVFKPAYDKEVDWVPWGRIEPVATPGRTVPRRSVVWPASRNPNRVDVFVVGHEVASSPAVGATVEIGNRGSESMTAGRCRLRTKTRTFPTRWSRLWPVTPTDWTFSWSATTAGSTPPARPET
jgi:hypothetical protein